MTANCHSCKGRFDVDDNRLPAAGHFLQCPHCGTALLVRPPVFPVRAHPQAPGANTTGEGTRAAPEEPRAPEPEEGEIDLPAPKGPSPSAMSDTDLPAPKGYFDELPAPRRTSNAFVPALPPESDWTLPESY